MTAREREQRIERILKRWRKFQREVSIIKYEDSILFGEVEDMTEAEKKQREEKKAFEECISYSMKWLKETQPELNSLIYGHYRMSMDEGYTKAGAASFSKSYRTVYYISKREYDNRRYKGLREIAFIATERGLLRHSE